MSTPTLVATYSVSFTTFASPKTTSVTVDAGDLLVLYAIFSDPDVADVAAPTGGGLTWVLKASANPTNDSDYAGAKMWVATATSSQTFTLSVAATNNPAWGWQVLRFSGASGIGATASTLSATPSLSLSTTQNDSVIVTALGDYDETNGSSRTWQAVNGTTPTSGNGYEVEYIRATGFATIYAAYYPDAGATGSKTVGLSNLASHTYSMVGVEVLGSVGFSQDAQLNLAPSLASAGVVGAVAGAALSPMLALSATATVVQGPHAPATLPLALTLAETHRQDTSSPAQRPLTVGLTAAGTVHHFATATLALSIARTTAGLRTVAATTDRTMTVSMLADGAVVNAGTATLLLGVGLGAAGYRASGAGTATRWVRVAGQWVKIPPTS